jgi:hypothetical protein
MMTVQEEYSIKSIVRRANSVSKTLETTIPREIIGYLELAEGDKLAWVQSEMEEEIIEEGKKSTKKRRRVAAVFRLGE